MNAAWSGRENRLAADAISKIRWRPMHRFSCECTVLNDCFAIVPFDGKPVIARLRVDTITCRSCTSHEMAHLKCTHISEKGNEKSKKTKRNGIKFSEWGSFWMMLVCVCVCTCVCDANCSLNSFFHAFTFQVSGNRLCILRTSNTFPRNAYTQSHRPKRAIRDLFDAILQVYLYSLRRE